MNKDKKVLYIISIVIFAVLLTLMLTVKESSKIATAIALVPLALLTKLCIRKTSSVSIYKREVLLIVTVVGAIYVILLQMSGIYFGFYENPYFVSSKIFVNFVLPTAVIIAATEIIRSTIIAQNNKLASAICFVSSMLIDILTVSALAGIISFNRFMDVVGLALFPAVSANIFYHYSAKNFGMFPGMVFRAITTLYVYFIPTTPAISDALMCCVKLILPIVMMALLMSLYEKRKRNARKKGTRLEKVAVVLTAVIIIAVAALISCQFRYGAIVVATESMTGEINKGDMILYERYEGQSIKEGQVIVFLDGKAKIVHRVVAIERVGNETRYYTKGDANNALDVGYRTQKDIFGLTDYKVALIGYPTLWIRDLISDAT